MARDAKETTAAMTALRPVHAPRSLAEPLPEAIAATRALIAYLDEAAPLLSEAEAAHRRAVVAALERLVGEWLVAVAGDHARCRVLISGSSKLGVAQGGDDIDVVVVAPSRVSRSSFFDDSARGFVGRLKARPEVSDLLAVATAMVPVVSVTWDGVKLDVLFAAVDNPEAVVDDASLLDDAHVQAADEATVLALNGPRVTHILGSLISDVATFAIVLRALRLWAKRRGVYSNRVGFLGGINCAILAAFACQLYPKATASVALERCFAAVADWPWPVPLMLVQPRKYYSAVGVRQWDVRSGRADKMPLITPALPNTNSAFNVTASSLKILRDEFALAAKVTARTLLPSPVLDTAQAAAAAPWADVFAPGDFARFERYAYVECRLGASEERVQVAGYVGSKLRWLVLGLEKLGASRIHPFAEAVDARPTALGWLVGVECSCEPLDPALLDAALQDFASSLRRKWTGPVGLSVSVRMLPRADAVERFPALSPPTGRPMSFMQALLKPAAAGGTKRSLSPPGQRKRIKPGA